MISFSEILVIFVLGVVVLYFFSRVGFPKRVKTNYIYHFTTPENAEKIVENGIASINGRRRGSDSNFFRITTFYFAGVPDISQLYYNINMKGIETLVAVRIKVSDLPSDIKFKSRLIDGAVFHSGHLKNVPAEIITIPRDRIRLVFQPILVLVIIGLIVMLLATLYLALYG